MFFSKWSHHVLYLHKCQWIGMENFHFFIVKCVMFLLAWVYYIYFWKFWIWLWSKMSEAVFQILRLGKSLELIMASFQLLNELDKVYLQSLNFNSTYSLLLRCPIILTRTIFDLVWFFFFFSMQRYPRVYLSNSSSSASLDLVVVKEVLDWLWLLNVSLILVITIYIYI